MEVSDAAKVDTLLRHECCCTMNQLLRDRVRAKVARISKQMEYINNRLDVCLSTDDGMSELKSELWILGYDADIVNNVYAGANTDRAYTQFCEFVEECLYPAEPHILGVSSHWDVYKLWAAAARKPRIIYQGQFKSFEHIHPCLLVRRPDCVFPFQ